MAGVIFALLLLGLTYINGRLDQRPPGWIDLLAGGELFLISAAVAADAVRKRSSRRREVPQFAFHLWFVVLIPGRGNLGLFRAHCLLSPAAPSLS
jgi:uncharacterized membrane protein YbhN (UPF0104 family)